jgi:hypothetical protein
MPIPMKNNYVTSEKPDEFNLAHGAITCAIFSIVLGWIGIYKASLFLTAAMVGFHLVVLACGLKAFKRKKLTLGLRILFYWIVSTIFLGMPFLGLLIMAASGASGAF